MVKYILVTGGAGYIGSHACKALRNAGYVPVTYDNLETGWRDAVRFGPFEEGDLRDRSRLDTVFAKWRPQAIMHFAALSEIGESTRDPGKYWRANILSSLTLIEAAVAAGCFNIIHSSTCAVYGEQDHGPLREDSPLQPINAYGASKRAIEDILKTFARSTALKFVIFRYFNVAGADPAAEIGEFHRPETHLIPLAVETALGHRDTLTIFGNDYPTPDGTCIRDYVHVVDVVAAHLLGLEWLDAGNGSEVFCLGSGRGFSILELVRETEAIVGGPVPLLIGARRPGDAARLVSDSTAAEAALGWAPRRSTLERMITDAWRARSTLKHPADPS
jgi:UDP-glucose 4-epimerase